MVSTRSSDSKTGKGRAVSPRPSAARAASGRPAGALPPLERFDAHGRPYQEETVTNIVFTPIEDGTRQETTVTTTRTYTTHIRGTTGMSASLYASTYLIH